MKATFDEMLGCSKFFVPLMDGWELVHLIRKTSSHGNHEILEIALVTWNVTKGELSTIPVNHISNDSL